MPSFVWRVLLCGVFLVFILSLWKTHSRIVREGVVLPATIVRHKWHRVIFRSDIVRFAYQGENIELEAFSSSFEMKEVGTQVEVIYWDNIPDKVVVQNSQYAAPYVIISIFTIVIFLFHK